MPSDNHKIVIKADKTPARQHARRFNAPTVDEVTIVVVGENRDIVLHRRRSQLQRVSETHRSYDALQYPILFWQGEDGYHFSMKMINPVTCSKTNKKFSSMNCYSYRLMVRENEDNHILKCRRLFHRYVVDMYQSAASKKYRLSSFTPDFISSQIINSSTRRVLKTPKKKTRYNFCFSLNHSSYLHDVWTTAKNLKTASIAQLHC